MNPQIEFTTESSTLDLYQYQIADTKLGIYPHQFQTLEFWDSKQNLLLTTATGSGKTAAALFPLIKDIPDKNREHAIFVYPTNALMFNQVKSMLKTFQMIKITDLETNQLRPIKAAVYPENMRKISYDNFVDIKDADIVLFIVNSETFEYFDPKKTKGRKFLEITQTHLKPSIYLTNPDTLYLLLSLRYDQSMRIISSFGEISTIVVDEFHTYNGIELANLIYTLRYGDELGMDFRKMFLSATPNKELQTILDQLFQPHKITSKSIKKAKKQRKIAHKVNVKLYPIGRRKDIIQHAKKIILDLQKKDKLRPQIKNDNQNIVPCVVILNSVINARELEEQLIQEDLNVQAYRGLMSRKERRLEGDVIVGTSAIEVGIDFDCYHLIMEASDSGSFIQRFGRVGRHNKGIAHVMVPQNVIETFEKHMNEIITRTLFNNKIRNAYPVRDALSWFLKDTYGIILASMLSQNLISELQKSWKSTKKQKKLAEEIEKQFINKLVKDLNISFSLINLKCAKNLEWFKQLQEHMFFRSSYPSIIVEDSKEKQKRPENYQYPVDLATLLHRGEPCEFIGYEDNKPVVKIDSYSKYHKVCFKSVKELQERELIINKPENKLYVIRESKPFNLTYLLENHVFIIVPSDLREELDWRTPLYPYSDGKTTKLIAFDGDALICKALLERRNKTLGDN